MEKLPREGGLAALRTVQSDLGTYAMEGKPGKRGTSDSGFGSTLEECAHPPPTKQCAPAKRGPPSVVAPAASAVQKDDEEVIRHEIREGRLCLLTWEGREEGWRGGGLLPVCIIRRVY